MHNMIECIAEGRMKYSKGEERIKVSKLHHNSFAIQPYIHLRSILGAVLGAYKVLY